MHHRWIAFVVFSMATACGVGLRGPDGFEPTDAGSGPCAPGDSRSCFLPGTEPRGACAAGLQTCSQNSTWGVCQVDTYRVDGTWRVRGTGDRRSCEPAYLNAIDFTLASEPIEVVHTASTSFSLAAPEDDFRIAAGSVVGRCVTFRTIERTDRGEVIYDWDGEVEGPGAIEGDFMGTGPGPCRTTGLFRIDVD